MDRPSRCSGETGTPIDAVRSWLWPIWRPTTGRRTRCSRAPSCATASRPICATTTSSLRSLRRSLVEPAATSRPSIHFHSQVALPRHPPRGRSLLTGSEQLEIYLLPDSVAPGDKRALACAGIGASKSSRSSSAASCSLNLANAASAAAYSSGSSEKISISRPCAGHPSDVSSGFHCSPAPSGSGRP
jgi:hypothetical protein